MNKKLLRALMIENGDTGKSLSPLMGISEQTFSAKINEKEGSEFNKSEMNFLKNRYKMSAQKFNAIFFGH